MPSPLEVFTRLVFCTPLEGYEISSLSQKEKYLHIAAAVVDVIDLVDAVLDGLQGLQMWNSGDRFYAFFLLCGVAIARIVAMNGKRVLIRGGLQWAPFFQDRFDFYSTTTALESSLPTLFCILFSEVSIFMFEDATLLNIWIATGSFDGSNYFDWLNAWVTLLSMSICLVLLVGCTLSFLRFWVWKAGWWDQFVQLVAAVCFVAVFGIIVLFLLSLVVFGYQAMVSDEPEILGDSGFLLVVILSWSFGCFFACSLQQKLHVVTRPIVAEELTGGGGTTENVAEPSRPSGGANDFHNDLEVGTWCEDLTEVTTTQRTEDEEEDIIPVVEAVVLESELSR